MHFTARAHKATKDGGRNFMGGLGARMYYEQCEKLNSGNCFFYNDDSKKQEIMREVKYGIDLSYYGEQDKNRIQYTLIEYINFYLIPILHEDYFGDDIQYLKNGISLQDFLDKSKEDKYEDIIQYNISCLKKYCKEVKNRFDALYY